MKIALCLHGYYNSSGGPGSGNKGFEYIQDKILDGNDVDVFVHSWDLPAKQLILDKYNPTLSLFEEQKTFDEEISNIDCEWFEENFNRKSTMYKNSIFQSFSFLYSRKIAIELKSKYEKDNNFEYDCVVLCRFDLGNRGKEHPQVFYATDIDFNLEADLSKLHMKYWDQFNWGIPEHWFYSNSKTMNLVGSLYDKLQEYYQKDSDYVKAVTVGWPESNANYEFSNEIFQKNKSKNLVKFAKWHCVDNHKIYKWFFHETGLSKNKGFGEPKDKNQNKKFSIVMYSHSSYSDCWPMFFGQTDKYFNNYKKYIFCDDDCSLVPPDWECIIYDEKLPYNRRVASCLEKVEEKIIIFHHEDMPLYQKPDYLSLNSFCDILDKEQIHFIKLLRGGITNNDSSYKNYNNLYQISDKIHYMAIQPTLWKTQSLLSVYRQANVSHVRDFENYASYICTRSGIEGVYCYFGEPKRGLYHYDSKVYPYISTAISKGKWNTQEYNNEIVHLSQNYKTNLKQRGTNS